MRGQPALSRTEALELLAGVEGVYVPSFYDATYNERWTRASDPARAMPVAPPVVVKRIVTVLPPPVTKLHRALHRRRAQPRGHRDQRGCTRGCRFCQAGMIFRPVRERPVGEVLAAVDEDGRADRLRGGVVPLASAAATTASRGAGERHGGAARRRRLSIGLPSLRIESFSVDLMEKLEKGRRRSGFTFAPEAATDRLRDVINKPISTQATCSHAREVYSRGWTTIKMYFMIGHPTQTLEDVQAIADLAHAVRQSRASSVLGKKANVRIGVSTLVPKPHTPFQWVPMEDEETIRAQIGLLQRELRGPGWTSAGTTRRRRCWRQR
jgi:radical SAM superfamily enzyme YgiQ (UPF0313 family)